MPNRYNCRPEENNKILSTNQKGITVRNKYKAKFGFNETGTLTIDKEMALKDSSSGKSKLKWHSMKLIQKTDNLCLNKSNQHNDIERRLFVFQTVAWPDLYRIPLETQPSDELWKLPPQRQLL